MLSELLRSVLCLRIWAAIDILLTPKTLFVGEDNSESFSKFGLTVWIVNYRLWSEKRPYRSCLRFSWSSLSNSRFSLNSFLLLSLMNNALTLSFDADTLLLLLEIWSPVTEFGPDVLPDLLAVAFVAYFELSDCWARRSTLFVVRFLFIMMPFRAGSFAASSVSRAR